MKTRIQCVDGRFPKVAPVPPPTSAADWCEELARSLDKLGTDIDTAFETRDAMIRELYAYVGVLVRRQNDSDHDRARLWADLKKRTRKAPAKRRTPWKERNKERP